eukprot:8499760-Lingulodinium_polyedra.AAC.1
MHNTTHDVLWVTQDEQSNTLADNVQLTFQNRNERHNGCRATKNGQRTMYIAQWAGHNRRWAMNTRDGHARCRIDS